MVVKSKIILGKYSWTKDKSTFVTGFTWLDGKYLSEGNFARFISEKSTSFENFSQTIQRLNGQYSVVVEREGEIWLTASHTWSYPLFYRTTPGQVVITDDPNKLLIDNQKPEFDKVSEIYFLTFGVTPLSNTLIKNIFQIQPGEILRIKEQNVEASSFLPFPVKIDQKSDPVSENDLREFMLSAFEKYYNRIKERQVLLPLTRGYDSRFLACLLKEFGHNNVICATWGRPSSREAGTAKRVAGQLGYEHFFVDYSKSVNQDFTQSKIFNSYVDFAGHFSSMPFLYEYFGVKELMEKMVISESTIALPGHPGDFLRGDHIGWDVVDSDRDYLGSKIISKFGTTFPVKAKERQMIHDYIVSNFLDGKAESLKQGYELWDYKERQCKFIGNSSQVFAFFGIQSLMPLFDLDVIKFFSRVPDRQKIDQNLYYSSVEKHFFKKLKVEFDLKTPQPVRNHSSFKEGILKMTPHFIKKFYYPLKDDIYYREVTQLLRSSDKEFHFKHPLRPNAYNSYITQWYLFSLQKLLGIIR